MSPPRRRRHGCEGDRARRNRDGGTVRRLDVRADGGHRRSDRRPYLDLGAEDAPGFRSGRPDRVVLLVPELWTRDRDAAEAFYSKLFGWGLNHKDSGPMPYGEWTNGGIPIGGMLQMNEQFGDAPPCWMPYVHVADCDATVAKAKELGGESMCEPTDIADVGRFALFQDPQGATLAIVTLTMPEE
ncbi:MAG: VOC family protein [Blastocatellia bacterium]|nr:VOC family protein [Blastocatellia bacterium]